MKSLAAILVEQKKPLVLDEIEVPPVGIGQVLVRIRTTRICGSQIGEIDGVKGPDAYLPHLLGHEAGGVVLETGPEVTHVRQGDSVVLHWRPGAGLQIRPARYQWRGQALNAGWVTTFQQFAVVAENRVTRVPASLPHDILPLLADTLTTGFGIVTRDARVRIGESIVIFGVGGIGLGVVLGARLAGAHPIIAVDLHDHKLKKAVQFGATFMVNSANQNPLQEIRELLDQGDCDVAVDGTGVPNVIETAYALTGKKGRCILFGVPHFGNKVQIHTLPLHFGKVLTGSEGGGSQPHDDIPRIVRMIQAGIFDPADFISHRFSLEQINKGIDLMRSGEVVHALVEFPSC